MDPHRRQLYHIPSESADHVWSRVRLVRPERDGGRVRVLESRNTSGVLTYTVMDNGLAVVSDWTYLPDLLFFNPVQYFLDHPHINEIWCDTTDTEELVPSEARSDPVAVRTVIGTDRSSGTSRSGSGRELPNYALVLCRHELTFAKAVFIRSAQANFFRSHNLPLPPARDFLNTIHDR